MKILFFTHLFPYPPNGGGYIRTYNILKHLSKKNKIDLVSYLYRSEDRKNIKYLQEICNDIKAVPLNRKPLLPYLPLSLISRLPYSHIRDYSRIMKRIISKQMEMNNYDIIFIEQMATVGYVSKKDKAYRIYANIAAGGMITDRYSNYQKNPLKKFILKLEAKKLKRLEIEVCRQVDLVITVSDDDKKVVESYGISGNKVVTVPMGVDIEKFKPIPLTNNSQNIIILGLARFPPNEDGILYFYNEIYPEIRQRCPGAHLYIVGAEPSKKILKLEKDSSVTVTGFVDDIDSFLKKTGVFVVPLRVGGGVKVRTLNALAMGMPIVATSIGVEGIEFTQGKEILVSDVPKIFAEEVNRVLRDPKLKEKLCTNGPILIREKYTWDAIFKQLDSIFGEIEEKINSDKTG